MALSEAGRDECLIDQIADGEPKRQALIPEAARVLGGLLTQRDCIYAVIYG